MDPSQGRNNLYVGNLDLRVTEALLRDIFQTIAPVGTVKILHDKNNQGFNYGFVEFFDHKSAEIALNSLDSREIFGAAIKVNWASQTAQKKSEEGAFHLFVGDLSNEVNDDILWKAFSPFGSLTEARVMWDPNTGKTRGYGFISYREKADAEMALNQMNGEFLGSRSIRCNWASQRNTEGFDKPNSTTGLSYDAILAQTPSYNTTVYVGNIAPETPQQSLTSYFQSFGYLLEVRYQGEKGFCFFKYDTHENAANAIFRLNGEIINGRQIKCSWGKEKPPSSSASGSSSGSPPGGAQVPPQMMYGAPMGGYPPPHLYGAPNPYYQMPPQQQQPYPGYEYYQAAGYDYSQYNYQQ